MWPSLDGLNFCFCLFQFKNKVQEKQRQQTLKQQADAASELGVLQAAQAPVSQRLNQKKLPAGKRRQMELQQDDASLLEDYRHLKKLKAGRMTEVRFAQITVRVQHLGLHYHA